MNKSEEFTERTRVVLAQRATPASNNSRKINKAKSQKSQSISAPIAIPIKKSCSTSQITGVLSSTPVLLAIKKEESSESSPEYSPSPTTSSPTIGLMDNSSPTLRIRSLRQSESEISPTLPLLTSLVKAAKRIPIDSQPNFENVIFVCGQHLLNTTASVIAQIILGFGAKPENIFIVGKTYSNNQDVISWIKDAGITHIQNTRYNILGKFVKSYENDTDRLWQAALPTIDKMRENNTLEGIIVLDDGGHVLQSTPMELQNYPHIVGIEQTSSGIEFTQVTSYPVIELARSAVKTWLEPPMVATEVARVVSERLNQIQNGNFDQIQTPEQAIDFSDKMRDFSVKLKSGEAYCGIVGYGNIGRSILNKLINMGYKKFVIFDTNTTNKSMRETELIALGKKNSATIFETDSLQNLIAVCDIVFGCTGKDITQNSLNMFNMMSAPKMLISCSSKDSEFWSVLHDIQAKKGRKTNGFDPLKTIAYKNGFGNYIVILDGGLPINFTGAPESVPAKDIQATRGLTAQAILQAFDMILSMKNMSINSIQELRKNFMLEPIRQQWVLRSLASIAPEEQYCPNMHYILPYKDKTIKEIKENSGEGEYRPSSHKALKPFLAKESTATLSHDIKQSLVVEQTASSKPHWKW